MQDLISKQQAIDAIGEKSDEIYKTKQKGATYPHDDFFQGMAYAENVVKQLPSAQPEPCEDAVSRETILKFFDGWMSVLDENCHNQSVSDLKIIKRDFANLPPVTPKQRTGKWIYCEDSMADCVDGYRCDKCGFFVPWDYTHKSIDYIKDYNYCPNCGAKMEVTE